MSPQSSTKLVDFVRPRLTVDAPWKLDEAEKEANPIDGCDGGSNIRAGLLVIALRPGSRARI